MIQINYLAMLDCVWFYYLLFEIVKIQIILKLLKLIQNQFRIEMVLYFFQIKIKRDSATLNYLLDRADDNVT